jgi:hypothetical protein
VGTLLDIIAAALVFSFVFCCIVSGILQVIAWSRHSVEGAPVSLRALWRPEGYFDHIGLRQIALARRLLTIGAVAYLSYGVLLIASSVLG